MTVFKRSNTIRNSKHKVQGICDVATLAVKQSLTKTLLVCLGILIVGVWLLIQLVIVPFMAELKDLRAQTSHSLFERNREIMRSTVELGASNIQQLFAATEVAVNTMITDLHSPKVKMAKSPFLPTAQEYLTADAIKKSMSPHPLYPDRLVSLEYPRVYYPSDEMSDARALEEKNLQGYWPSFEKTVSSLHSLTGEFKWLYVASETGMLLVYPGSDNVPKGYDPRVRPWYVGAMGRQAGYWTPPYYTAGGNEIVITFSQPLGQHAFMKNAVVAADLVLTDIINKVLFTPLCDECKIYLVNERDEIIAQREPATLKASWTEPLPVKTLGEVLASRADVVGEGNDGQHNIFSVSIDRLHWRLVGVIYNHSLGNDGGQIIARISSFSQKNKTALMIIMGVVLAIVLILMGTLYLIVRRTMRTKMEPSLDQFKRLAQNLDAVHLDNVLSLMAGDATNVTESLTHEHKIVVEALQRLGDKLLNAEKQIETKSKLAAVGETAGQVAHDIRSPLTALSVIAAELGELAEEKRLLIRSAVQRIEDIANDLSSKRVQRPKTNDQSQKQGEIVIPAKAGIQNITPTVDPSLRWDDKTNPTLKGTSDTLSLPPLATNSHLLSAVVESLVSEKRTQYRNRSGVTIEANLGSESYGLFANIQLDQFKRVLSNIVNNAVEAMEGGGSLVVAMRAVEPQSHRAYDSEFTEAPTPHGSMAQDIQITIIDTGKGIPAEILPRLFRCGESFGKIDGAGLGLYL
ncbi:MAG TPA: ATP-binding protein, partial [bacterium]|nr:ATP-binding protein [bacterium]